MNYIIAIVILFAIFGPEGIFFRFVDWIDPKIRDLVYRIIR